MVSTKLNNLIEKYNLTNLIKVIVILIILFLLYRIFIESSKYQIPYSLNKNIYEGFAPGDLGNANTYGNVISLLEPTNMPVYNGDTCNFTLNNTFRIDTLIFQLNTMYADNHKINISFIDGNGNKKYIKATVKLGIKIINDSPPSFKPDTEKKLHLTQITDENDLPVYTSQINFTVTGTKIDIMKNAGYNYIKGYAIYGGDRNLPTLKDFESTKKTLDTDDNFGVGVLSTTASVLPNQKSYNFKQKNSRDTKIYYLSLPISITTIKNPPNLTETPFTIKITYQNSVYPNNVFTINTSYIVRSDYNTIAQDRTFIFLTEPIIANSITFTITDVALIGDAATILNLKVSDNTTLNVLSKTPSESDISDYKQTINLLQSTSNDTTNVCPSINELVNTQTKTQQICDNLEYQDKVKSEKLRLERNKQYLLKLKDQQDQIDQLNTAIQTLEDSRQARANTSDQVRVLQYQKQKADASSIRDLANQRLESQENNQLYMDVSVNAI